MKSIIIYTYDFDMGIGGIKVMHKLCHMLNEVGYESYLMPIHIRNEFFTYYDNTPIVTEKILNDIENCIVIYPEGIKYNPLNSKNVIRWILGPPREEDIITYSKDDMIFWYMDYYYLDHVGQKENQLFIPEFHEDIFFNQNKERMGSSYCIRKCKDPRFIHPEDSIFIPYHGAGNLVELANLFNQTEKFYCYDNYTFLSVQAAMCGCISIVIPDGTKTKEEWLNGSKLNKYGIAIGEDDIPRALETLPLLYQEIENINLEMHEQINIFINKCKNKFK
jgi:hypothetical protein